MDKVISGGCFELLKIRVNSILLFVMYFAKAQSKAKSTYYLILQFSFKFKVVKSKIKKMAGMFSYEENRDFTIFLLILHPLTTRNWIEYSTRGDVNKSFHFWWCASQSREPQKAVVKLKLFVGGIRVFFA